MTISWAIEVIAPGFQPAKSEELAKYLRKGYAIAAIFRVTAGTELDETAYLLKVPEKIDDSPDSDLA